MVKYRIFTLGFELPGDEFEYIEFSSDKTLLDADIILIEPHLSNVSSYERYNGKPLLSQYSSFSVKEYVDHWRSEIVAAVNSGKIVLVYLVKPQEYFRYSGEKQHSGTGRSRVTTNIVAPISSYDSIPNLDSVIPKSGTSMRLDKDAKFLATYWNEFSNMSSYEVEIEGNFKGELVRASTGKRIVGAYTQSATGHLIFLPPIHYDEEEFTYYDEEKDETFWTENAVKFGKRLISSLVSIANSLKSESTITPPPDWSNDSSYRLAKESELELAISECFSKISDLQTEKAAIESELIEAGKLRRLLFEHGKPLEAAILEALKLMGFDAQQFDDGESEFDAVFVSPEGRCIGEAEGKDNRAINIVKFSQLERNLQEDFARDDVSEYAKGVLFGNAFRLTQVENRNEPFFTQKCLSAAQRVKAALIRTPDLFGPAKYLKENPGDTDYAKECRVAIFNCEGEIVVFPEAPISETNIITEAALEDET